MQTMLAQGPPKRHLALCPKEQKGNTGATGRVGPPLPSHRVTLSPFPVSLDGFARGMSASSKPRRMWVTSLWTGCVHTPGESSQGGMGRVQAGQAALADLLRGVSSLPGVGEGVGVSEQTCISAHFGSRSSSGQKQQPYWPGTARQQGWLTVTVIAQLPTGSGR